MIFVISLSHTWYNNYQFYYHFYVDSESKTSYNLTSTTHLPTAFSSSSGSIVTPTPTDMGNDIVNIDLYPASSSSLTVSPTITDTLGKTNQKPCNTLVTAFLTNI